MKNLNELTDQEILTLIKEIINYLPIYFDFEKQQIMESLIGQSREILIQTYEKAILIKGNFDKNKEHIMNELTKAAKKVQISYMQYKNALDKYNISQKELLDKNEENNIDEMLNNI